MFNLQNLYQQPLAILQILGILLASYATCRLSPLRRLLMIRASPSSTDLFSALGEYVAERDLIGKIDGILDRKSVV